MKRYTIGMTILAVLYLATLCVLTWAKRGVAYLRSSTLETGSVGCFTCTSFNGSNVGCEDPFHPAYSTYEPECKQGMPERVGLFFAPFCIKMNGERLSNGDTIMVRTCSLNNMGHQCGIFQFEDIYYKGCLTTCYDDACNHSNRLYLPNMNVITLCLLATLLVFNSYQWTTKSPGRIL